MTIEGFSQKWKDFPDYIIGITKEIWEDRGIDTLNQYYAPDIPVRSPGSVVRGNQGVIAATMATLAEFPDRTLLGEDVIWSGPHASEDGKGDHLLSSHRLFSTATHTHPGMYGAPTGKRLTYRIIADCAARNNQIDDEWLIRDQGAIVRQIGWDPKDFARDLIEREGGLENCVKPLTPENDIDGPYNGKGNDSEWGEHAAHILTALMAGGMHVIGSHYDRACALAYPGHVAGHSHGDADRFWMGLRASFPNAKFDIHHQIGREDPLMPPRSALRWSLHGKHDGWGTFGTPTNADVYILGATHFEFGPFGEKGWSVRREFTLFDETAIWKQILMQTGDVS